MFVSNGFWYGRPKLGQNSELQLLYLCSRNDPAPLLGVACFRHRTRCPQSPDHFHNVVPRYVGVCLILSRIIVLLSYAQFLTLRCGDVQRPAILQKRKTGLLKAVLCMHSILKTSCTYITMHVQKKAYSKHKIT